MFSLPRLPHGTRWCKPNEANNAVSNESLVDYAVVMAQVAPFYYPAICEVIKIGLTDLATTCSIERTLHVTMCQDVESLNDASIEPKPFPHGV